VCIKVEVVDVYLDYNLLLGRIWTYAMQEVVTTVFWVLLFPHEGRIVTTDQLSFSHPDPSSRESMVSMIDNPQYDIINIGFGFFPPLMGIFDYPPPSGNVNFIPTYLRLRFFKSRRFVQPTSTIHGLFLLHHP
jgi:hypothetical protein